MTLTVSEGPSTRLGRLLLAGEIVDAEPIMPPHFRVMDAYVLSVVLDGEGTYRDADGREEPLVPGAHTLVLPEFRTGTAPVPVRLTELFAVFTGPLFNSLADLGSSPPVRATRSPYRRPTSCAPCCVHGRVRNEPRSTNCWP